IKLARALTPPSRARSKRRYRLKKRLRLPAAGAAKRGLRRRQTRDRHTERRTRDVVELRIMTKGDRGGIAAVLAANPHLQLGTRLAPAFDADAHQFADTLLIDGDKGIDGENAALEIDAEKACRIVAADAEGRLRQIVGAEGKEFGALGDLAGEQRRPRQLDHGADLIIELLPGFLGDRFRDRIDAGLDRS